MIVNIDDSDVGINNMSTLIRKLSFIFKYDQKNISNYRFEITPSSLDSVSALVIFKFFEYSLKNSCLKSPLDPNNKNHVSVMKNAFKRGYSSKKNEKHCGTGL